MLVRPEPSTVRRLRTPGRPESVRLWSAVEALHAWRGGTSHHHSIERQDDDRADRGHDEPGRVVRSVQVQGAADEAADHGADDAEEHGDEDSATIASGHHEFGDGADDQAEDDPTQNSHLPTPSACTTARR